ncbi:hypothetical protein AZE42_01836 [Rhizopogon vesiculosus]|uniref:Uncharacterized protein n=1 Tax=Rhizopogon vesiculosus TaxID=180088 RepID=A0A1J8Q956_9AGAM|nr:hypothetical protein AZE42_01836 [Rhizopogon vesiculosus]
MGLEEPRLGMEKYLDAITRKAA